LNEQELYTKIRILESEVSFKKEECETYKKLLEQANDNVVKINKTNGKILRWIVIPAILGIVLISGMLLYGYFWTSYDYGVQNNNNTTTNKIENSQGANIQNNSINNK
jgi:hypothetical protein